MEHLEPVRQEVSTGVVSAQALVLVYRALEEAAESGDAATLDESIRLARDVARLADPTLRGEAERLVALCEARREQVGIVAADGGACEECGREVAQSAVRCRHCGTLLV